MDLRVDDAAMRALVAKSIVDSLSPEAREQLITNAVAQVLTVPEQDGHGRKKRSPLQMAFDDAVLFVAQNYAREILQNDHAFQAKIKGLFVDVVEQLFLPEKREKLVDNMTRAIEAGLHKSY